MERSRGQDKDKIAGNRERIGPDFQHRGVGRPEGRKERVVRGGNVSGLGGFNKADGLKSEELGSVSFVRSEISAEPSRWG
jgi:hypothetical protein